MPSKNPGMIFKLAVRVRVSTWQPYRHVFAPREVGSSDIPAAQLIVQAVQRHGSAWQIVSWCERHSRSGNVRKSGEMLVRDRDVNVPWPGTRPLRICAAAHRGMPPVSLVDLLRTNRVDPPQTS
ncbi:hypothetical protein KM043_006556 [Ampulex compressa]|nr:hypothetical protein KM043_006556 [Ampulex compressa]